MDKKILSIIIPSYIRPNECRRLCDKFSQFQRVEVIVVVNAVSSTGLVNNYNEILNGVNADVIYTNNKGQSVANNIGLKKATAQWVWFFDDDDDVDFSSLDILMDILTSIDSTDMVLLKNRIGCDEFRNPMGEGWCRKQNFTYSLSRLVNTTSVLFNRSSLCSIRGWDEKLHSGTDTDIFFSAIKNNFQCLSLDRPVVYIDRTRSDRITKNIKKQILGRFQIIKKHWGTMSLFVRIRYLLGFLKILTRCRIF